MKKQIFSLLVVLSGSFFSSAQNFIGDWTGNLNVQNTSIRLIFHIQKEAGSLSSTFDSPDQKAFGLEIKTTVQKGDSIFLGINMINASFRGKILHEDTVSGIYTQNNVNFPLILTRDKNETQTQSQTATDKSKVSTKKQEKNTFISEEITFITQENSKFSGTLTLPKGKGPFPAVILVSGSGPQNRDEELMGLKPFYDLSTYLSNHGIAVLRYDDRGIGKSEGDFSTATSFDFSNDAEAAFEFLKTQPKIDSKKVGIIGHSEGGMIAPMIASRNKEVAFIVSLAGPAIPISELMLMQSELVARSQNYSEKEIATQQKMNSTIFKLMLSEKNLDSLKAKLKLSMTEHLKEEGIVEDSVIQQELLAMNGVLTPWFRYFIQYNPQPVIELVTCPVLALNGERDIQVPSQANLQTFKTTLEKAGNKNIEIHEFKQMNHLFQICTTCTVDEYMTFDYAFDESVLKMIASWVKKQ